MKWLIRSIFHAIEQLIAKAAAKQEEIPQEREVPAGRYWGPFWNHHDGLD